MCYRQAKKHGLENYPKDHLPSVGIGIFNSFYNRFEHEAQSDSSKTKFLTRLKVNVLNISYHIKVECTHDSISGNEYRGSNFFTTVR